MHPAARRILAALFLGIAATPAWAHEADDPLTRPIAPRQAAKWLGTEAPIRVFGNSYLVGFSGLTVALVRTSEGLVLVDGGVPQSVAAIEANVRALGFRIEDIRYILSTEPHWDHAGGLAALARDTGATVVASASAAKALRQGHSDADDPQRAWLSHFPPVADVKVLADGGTLTLGDTVITARATPGHTPGSMSWTWRSCEGSHCVDAVFASSLNPLAADGYAFSSPEHAPALAAFRQTFDTLRALPCGLLLTAHPGQSGGEAKLAALRRSRDTNPYLDAGACRSYANTHEALLDTRLAEERAAAKR